MKRHLKLKKEKKREEEDLPVNDKRIVNRILLHWNPLTCKESTKYYLCNITGMGKFKLVQRMAEDW